MYFWDRRRSANALTLSSWQSRRPNDRSWRYFKWVSWVQINRVLGGHQFKSLRALQFDNLAIRCGKAEFANYVLLSSRPQSSLLTVLPACKDVLFFPSHKPRFLPSRTGMHCLYWHVFVSGMICVSAFIIGKGNLAWITGWMWWEPEPPSMPRQWLARVVRVPGSIGILQRCSQYVSRSTLIF